MRRSISWWLRTDTVGNKESTRLKLVQLNRNAGDLSGLIGQLRSLLAEETGLPSERALAEQLNVKRHQLRRALEVLREGGEMTPSDSRRKPFSLRGGEALIRSTNPVEVIEMRLVIEPALARLAALRATPFAIAAIERAATTPSGEESGAADLVFHKLIATSAGNSLASDFYNLLRQVGTDARLRIENRQPQCPNRTKQRDSEHRAIASAIASRDPAGAEDTMRAHLVAVQALVLNGMTARASVA
jgi:DNA-binding FadR family transcriptional regulator